MQFSLGTLKNSLANLRVGFRQRIPRNMLGEARRIMERSMSLVHSKGFKKGVSFLSEDGVSKVSHDDLTGENPSGHAGTEKEG